MLQAAYESTIGHRAIVWILVDASVARERVKLSGCFTPPLSPRNWGFAGGSNTRLFVTATGQSRCQSSYCCTRTRRFVELFPSELAGAGGTAWVSNVFPKSKALHRIHPPPLRPCVWGLLSPLHSVDDSETCQDFGRTGVRSSSLSRKDGGTKLHA